MEESKNLKEEISKLATDSSGQSVSGPPSTISSAAVNILHTRGLLKKQFKWADIASQIGNMPVPEPLSPKSVNNKTSTKRRRRYRRKQRKSWSSDDEDLSDADIAESTPDLPKRDERPPTRRSAANVRILAQEAAQLLEDEGKESEDDSWKEETPSDTEIPSSQVPNTETGSAAGPVSSDAAPDLGNSPASQSAIASEPPSAPMPSEATESRGAAAKETSHQSDLESEMRNSTTADAVERLGSASLLLASASEAAVAPSAGPESEVKQKQDAPTPKEKKAKEDKPPKPKSPIQRKRAASSPAGGLGKKKSGTPKSSPVKTQSLLFEEAKQVQQDHQEAVSIGRLQYQPENDHPTNKSWVPTSAKDSGGAPSSKRAKISENSTNSTRVPQRPFVRASLSGAQQTASKSRRPKSRPEIEFNMLGSIRFVERHQMVANPLVFSEGLLSYESSVSPPPQDAIEFQHRVRISSLDPEPHSLGSHASSQTQQFVSFGQAWPRPDQVMHSQHPYADYGNARDDLSPGSSNSYSPDGEYGVSDDYDVTLAHYADWDTGYSNDF